MKKLFSKQKQMNNNKPINNYKGFDDVLINKDVIEFSKAPKNLDREFEHTNPYTSFEDEGNSTNPLLSKDGAKQVKADLKNIYKNQENFNSKHYMSLDGDKLREATNTLNAQDIGLNDQLTNDIKQGALVNGDGFKTVGKNDIFDGRQSLTVSGNSAPNVYQINHNPEDQRDQLDSVKNNPQDINYLITNYTNPIMNNEELKTSNTSAPQSYKCGREMTKDNAGIYVACANTPNNRKKLDKILKKYAPQIDKIYQKDIEPYARQINPSRNPHLNINKIFRKSQRESKDTKRFNKNKIDKEGQVRNEAPTPKFRSNSLNNNMILAKKKLAHKRGRSL